MLVIQKSFKIRMSSLKTIVNQYRVMFRSKLIKLKGTSKISMIKQILVQEEMKFKGIRLCQFKSKI